MASRHAPLDDSHQPFKRLTVLGPRRSPGPRGREPISEQKNWECNKIRGAKYSQLCVWVGADAPGHKRGSRKVVKTDPAWKKKYNKEYNKFLEDAGRPRARRNVAQPAYRYRKPKEVARAGSGGAAAGRGGRGARAAAAAAPARRAGGARRGSSAPPLRSRLVQPRRRAGAR